MPPDFITRESEDCITEWGKIAGCARTNVDQTKWKRFAECAPMLPFEDSHTHIPAFDVLNPDPVIGASQPASGAFLTCGLSSRRDGKPFTVGNIDNSQFVVAQDQSISEIKFTRSLLETQNGIQSRLISPPGVCCDSGPPPIHIGADDGGLALGIPATFSRAPGMFGPISTRRLPPLRTYWRLFFVAHYILNMMLASPTQLPQPAFCH